MVLLDHDLNVCFALPFFIICFTHPKIVDSTEVVVLLPGNHEGGQVGCVHGEEDDGKQRPDAAHEPETEQCGATLPHCHLFNEWLIMIREQRRPSSWLVLETV